MKEGLCDQMEITEEFTRNSPFGSFLDVQLVSSPAMLWQLMVREANVGGEGAQEMWFSVNGVPLRYSLTEFSLITGLRCSELPARYDEGYDSKALGAFVEENWPKGLVCYTSVVDRFSKLCQLLRDDGTKGYASQWIVKVAALMFVVQVLIGHAKKDVPIPNWIIAKIASRDDSMTFPWGTWAFLESLRVQSFRKDLVAEKKKLKGGKTSNTLRYTGFVLPPSYLLFECIPEFGVTFGVKRGRTDQAIPRMCLWRNECPKKLSHTAIENAINKAKTVRSILLPEGNEVRAPWFTTLTTLPSVSNPALSALVRKLQNGETPLLMCMKKVAPSDIEDKVVAGKDSPLEEAPVRPPKKIRGRILRPSTSTSSEKKEEFPPSDRANGNISTGSGKASENILGSLREYMDGKFSEIQENLCRVMRREVKIQVERQFKKYASKYLRGNTRSTLEPQEVLKEERVDRSPMNVRSTVEKGVDVGREMEEKVEMMCIAPLAPQDAAEDKEVEGKSYIISSAQQKDESGVAKIIEDAVEFCKSTGNVDVVSSDDDIRVLEGVDDGPAISALVDLGRGRREKKRSNALRTPYTNPDHKRKRTDANANNALLRSRPSSKQLEAFTRFLREAIADGREVQCINGKRAESHGLVKKWWSTLIKPGGWLETSHMEEIIRHLMQLYNSHVCKSSAILPEPFQMMATCNAMDSLFPCLGDELREYVEGTSENYPEAKAWANIESVLWIQNMNEHWVCIKADFKRKCLVVFDSLHSHTTMSALSEHLKQILKMIPAICNYASTFLKAIPGDHSDLQAQWTIERPQVPQQGNLDCGIYALKFMELVVQNLDFSSMVHMDVNDISKLHANYAYAICRDEI